MKHYDYNAEAVINAVLEDNLPPHLNERTNVPDLKPTQETFSFDEPADISKKSRTKYVILFIIYVTIRMSYGENLTIYRTVHFDEMREILNDKQDMKNVILERVNEQIAAEVFVLISC